MEIKKDDVYTFYYNEEQSTKSFDPYWCFDGQLIVKERRNGELYLEDTYWFSGDNKTFTLQEALSKGTLTFKCNLNNVDQIKYTDLIYYADEDIIDCSYQHHCYFSYYKKKGAKKSPEKMKRIILEKISNAQHEIESKTYNINILKEKLEQVENGNTDIYIF